MKTKLLYSVAIAAAALAATPAAAQVHFAGTTQGCLTAASSCSPVSGTSSIAGLTYTSGGFAQWSDNSGYLSIGDIVNNLGHFTLTGDANAYAGDNFDLLINFTDPGNANSAYSAFLKGTVVSLASGSVGVHFQDPLTQFITSSGGNFTVTLPSLVGVTPSRDGTAPTWVSAEFQAVPEPATWAMMLLGFAGIGLAVRGRRRPVLAQVA